MSDDWTQPSDNGNVLEEPYVHDERRGITSKRKKWGVTLAVAGLAFIVIGALAWVEPVGIFSHYGVPHPNYGLIWFGFSSIYCSALVGLVNTDGGAPRMALGCFGAILFAITFLTAVQLV